MRKVFCLMFIFERVKMTTMHKTFVTTCLLNFLIAALLGLLLRYAFINDITFNFRFLTHAHSHIAMLGWVYLMIFTLFNHYFVTNNKRFYKNLFWVTQFAVVGMLFSFPFQGYAAASITFSTLHILCSYVFVFRIWKDMKLKNRLIENSAKWALAFMTLSTFGVWCLGPAVSLMGKTSAFYQTAIQFFLHFQFNGWFLFAVIAVFFHQLQIQPSKNSKLFLRLLIFATFCSFALPLQWFAPHWSLFYINVLGWILQLIALIYFLKIIKEPYKIIVSKSQKTIRLLFVFALSCLVLKLILQGLSVVPKFAQTLINHKNFIIGFIHLMMLGVVSGFLFAFLLFSKTIKHSTSLNIGIYCFLLGFSSTELLLAYQGGLFYLGKGLLPKYHLILFVSSVFLPLGIAIILLTYLRQKINAKQTLKTL